MMQQPPGVHQMKPLDTFFVSQAAIFENRIDVPFKIYLVCRGLCDIVDLNIGILPRYMVENLVRVANSCFDTKLTIHGDQVFNRKRKYSLKKRLLASSGRNVVKFHVSNERHTSQFAMIHGTFNGHFFDEMKHAGSILGLKVLFKLERTSGKDISCRMENRDMKSDPFVRSILTKTFY